MIFTILKETDSDVAGDVSYEGCKYKSGQELIGFDGTWEAKREIQGVDGDVILDYCDDDSDDDDLIKSERVEEDKSVKERRKLKPNDRSEQFLPVKHNRTFYMFSSSA